ncbi:sialic acid synthase isoform X2 [Nilaparvata lugens]|nr:sialic acid synthase isoform X2 [Nilaparvata lugens]
MMQTTVPDLIISADKVIGTSHPCFIIAEIGQNHQGDIEIAKKLIQKAKICGADCVKFQKSHLQSKFTQSALNRPYDSPHAWGKTYGQHKEFLEFTADQYYALQEFAKEIGILFTASGMDIESVDFLANMKVPFIKIGSGDADNFPLIKRAARTHLPLIISTGMQDYDLVKKIYQCVKSVHSNFVLMHCVSSYPTPVEDVNLRVLELYRRDFPDIHIGYSGHELGITISTAAVALGAKVLERHLTLDKTWKGNDHQSSLDPTEFQQLVSNVRHLERALGTPSKQIQGSEQACIYKLSKSIVASKPINKGEIITPEKIAIKVSEPRGIRAGEIETVIGKIAEQDVDVDEPIIISTVL